MSTDLKPGHRVRLTNKLRVPGFTAGARGRILRGPNVVRELTYYLVAMDPPSQSTAFLFAQEEIEPDMAAELKVGDRVRVWRPSRGYQVGDKGTVLEGPGSYTADDEQSYVVAMDKDGPGRTSIVFTHDAIELDA